MPTNEFLRHGSPRLVYAVTLVKNLRDYLLGIDQRPRYIVPQTQVAKTTQKIVNWWLDRWVSKRVVRDDVLQRMQEHTLVHPIRHGARVRLPTADTEQLVLFG